ncbi:MAG: phosphoribosylformylglycinamidine synthase I [Acidobacteria bacterium RBG_16_68_9]|nr:MAG: phosphoribosylformylglycinamidine synthase I [Acidobacteria bacterium RBG_16_68_9]
MRWGVVTFPGSLDDLDAVCAIESVLGDSVARLWHKDRNLHGVDCVILPGGFSYGDYLRPGAIARLSPVMDSVIAFAQAGGLVIGICNGFQILCEAGLLPGALIRNRSLSFVCTTVRVRVEETETPFTNACARGEVLSLPIKHGEGCFVADARTVREIEENGQVVFRYVDASGRATDEGNPNGSLNNIAGVVNATRSVLGLMPHPEHACERLLGNEDGARLFRSVTAATTAGGWSRPASVPPGM